MPVPGHFRWLIPIGTALAVVLLLGVAALLHLAPRRRVSATPWPEALAQLAAASPWRGRDLGLLVAILALAQLARRIFLPASIACDVLAFQGVAIAGAALLAWRKPRPFGAPAPLRAVLGQALLRWLAILPVLWFFSFTWQLLLQALGHAPDFQLAVRLFIADRDPWHRLAFIGFAVVAAPVAEEILFRGLLLPLLIRNLGAAGGLTLVALGFAALHADAGTFLVLAIFSVALSLAYARTGTLAVPILMHALFNGANLALLLALVHAGVLK